MRPNRLQTTYQRNLLCGTAVVIVLSAASAFWLTSLGRKVTAPFRVTRIEHIAVNDSSAVVREEHAAVTALARLNPYLNRHRGFFGFVNLVSARAADIPVVTPPAVVTSNPELTVESPDFPPSYSPIPGDDTGLFLPPNAALAPLDFDDQPHPPVTRPVQLIREIPPDIPSVAQWDNRQGYVEILMLVDSDGRPGYFSCRQKSAAEATGPAFELDIVLTDSSRATIEFFIDDRVNSLKYVELQERPRGYYFAEYLLKVLPEWRFAPAVRDGVPVASFVVVQYMFCLQSDPNCPSLQIKPVS